MLRPVSLISGISEENRWPATSHKQTLWQNVVSSTPRAGSNSQLLGVIGTDCIGSCKSNYHTITTAPNSIKNPYSSIIMV
jgi:hypothetical protein